VRKERRSKKEKKKKRKLGRKQYSFKGRRRTLIIPVGGWWRRIYPRKRRANRGPVNSHDSKNVAYYTEFVHDLLEERN
jgi:hypothetical protein